MKEPSDEQLEFLGQEMSKALVSWQNAWNQGMKSMRIDSKEYQEICKADKKMQSSYDKMRSIAENRNWHGDKIRSIFSAGGCWFT